MGRAHYQEIPKFWDEICEKYAANVYAGNEPANETKWTVALDTMRQPT